MSLDLLQSDLGILAMLMTAMVGTGVAILRDHTAERRRSRSPLSDDTEPLA